MWRGSRKGYRENSYHLVCYSVCFHSFISFLLQLVNPSLSNTALRFWIPNLKGHETSILVGEVFGWKNEKKKEPRERSRVMRTPGMTKRSQKFQQLLSSDVHFSAEGLPLSPHLDLRSVWVEWTKTRNVFEKGGEGFGIDQTTRQVKEGAKWMEWDPRRGSQDEHSWNSLLNLTEKKWLLEKARNLNRWSNLNNANNCSKWKLFFLSWGAKLSRQWS